MSERAFGVELEFASNGLDRDGVARVLRNEFDRRGMRRWYFMNRLDYDGSEIELRTPILRGKKGFETLKVVMNTLADAGCECYDEDGMHVHHDAPEFVYNIENCIKLVKSWKANQHIIYQFVNPRRTFDSYDGEGWHWACPQWSNEAVQELERKREIPYWDRNDLNLNALSEHGSIEIRLHEGTLDFTTAESWIKFGQSFIDRVLKHSMRTSKDATNLLKKVQVSSTAEKVLIDKAREMSRMRGRYYNESY